MTDHPPVIDGQAFATLLAETRAVLHRRAALRAAAHALPLSVWLLAAGGFGMATRWGAFGVGVALVCLAFVWLAYRVVRAWQRKSPTLCAAAEHLDAAQDAHNRIATALAFAQAPTDSLFAQSAITQGWATLQACRRQEPFLRPIQIRWQSIATPLVLFALACVLSLALDFGSPATDDGRSATPATGTSATITGVGGQPDVAAGDTHEERRLVRAPATALQESPAASATRATPAVAGTRAQPQQASLGTGSQAATADGAQAGGLGGSQSTASTPSATRATPERTASQVPQSALGQRGQSAHAQIRGASPGANAGQAATGETDSRDQPAGDDEFVPGDEPEPTEEAEQNQQRGGLRASLLDRRAAASRELGITGPKSGRPGTGRGGPTPRKKSRGTASIIMGVPMPDFLAGQRRSGPFVSNNSRAVPVPGDDTQPTAAIPAQPAAREAVLQPFRVPLSEAETIKQYLKRWHSLAASPAPTDGEEGESTAE